jgi:hypothetical protein
MVWQGKIRIEGNTFIETPGEHGWRKVGPGWVRDAWPLVRPGRRIDNPVPGQAAFSLQADRIVALDPQGTRVERLACPRCARRAARASRWSAVRKEWRALGAVVRYVPPPIEGPAWAVRLVALDTASAVAAEVGSGVGAARDWATDRWARARAGCAAAQASYRRPGQDVAAWLARTSGTRLSSLERDALTAWCRVVARSHDHTSPAARGWAWTRAQARYWLARTRPSRLAPSDERVAAELARAYGTAEHADPARPDLDEAPAAGDEAPGRRWNDRAAGTVPPTHRDPSPDERPGPADRGPVQRTTSPPLRAPFGSDEWWYGSPEVRPTETTGGQPPTGQDEDGRPPAALDDPAATDATDERKD